jgi:iron complex transport system ATP-binding protein
MAEVPPLIRARVATFRYPAAARNAVEGVSASWFAGQFHALVGPNGSGKTTLLSLLSGALQPVVGSIQWDGKPLPQADPAKLACRRAVLPQSPRLDFGFTVEEVVALGRSPFGDRPERRDDRTRIDAALEEVGLLEMRHRPFPRLSRGEKQRAQLARILAQLPGTEPEKAALLLDEPINHLDLEHQHSTLAIARRRAQDGMLVIAVLHDLNLALRYADRVLVMDRGVLKAEGTPDAVFKPELLRSIFHVDVERVQASDGSTLLAFRGRLPTE